MTVKSLAFNRLLEKKSLIITAVLAMIAIGMVVQAIADSSHDGRGAAMSASDRSVPRVAADKTEKPARNNIPQTSHDRKVGRRFASLQARADARQRRFLASPRARRQRQSSRTRFRSLGSRAAVSAVRQEQAAAVENPNWSPPDLQAGEKIVGYAAEDVARIEKEGSKTAALVQSFGEPLAAPEGGRLTPIDLQLDARPDGWAPKNVNVDSVLPTDLSKPIRVGLANKTTAVEVVPAASSAPGILINNQKVFYANAQQDTDVIVEAVPTGVELSWSLRSPAAPAVVPFKFDLPLGGDFKLNTDGSASILFDDRKLAAISAPLAFDAQGQSVATRFGLAKGGLEIQTDHRGKDLAYPVLVDPVVNVYPGVIGVQATDVGGGWATGGWVYGRSSTGLFPDASGAAEGTGYRFYLRTVTGTAGQGVAWWGLDAPRDSTIFRTEFALVGFTPAYYNTLTAGIYGKVNGFPDTKWGGYYNSSTDALIGAVAGAWSATSTTGNGFTPQYKVVGCTTNPCGWGGPADTTARLELSRNLTTTIPSNKPTKASMRGGFAYYSDYSNPTLSLTGVPASSSNWQNVPLPMSASVSDPGVGIGLKESLGGGQGQTTSAFEVVVDSGQTYARSEGYGPVCDGGMIYPCPSTTNAFQRDLSEGQHTYDFRATDIVGHATTQHFDLKIDRAGPAVNLSGRLGGLLQNDSLTTATPRVLSKDTPFTITALDGSTTNNAARRSGVKSIHAYLTSGSFNAGSQTVTDSGVSVKDYGTTNTGSGCAAPNDSCKGTLSGTIAVASGSPVLAPGYYYLHIHADDQIGNVTDQTYRFGVGNGDITTITEGQPTAKYVPLQAQQTRGPAATTAKFQWRTPTSGTTTSGLWQDVPLSALKYEFNGTAPSSTSLAVDQFGFTLKVIVDIDLLAPADSRPKNGPVMFRALFGGTGAESTRSSEDISMELDRGGKDTYDKLVSMGPGSVDAQTGNLTVSATDASIDAYISGLSVSRTYSSRYASPNDDQGVAREVGPLGPGWELSLPTDGGAFTQLTDHADFTRPEEEQQPYVEVETAHGSQINFELADTPNTNGTDRYVPGPGLESYKLERCTTSDCSLGTEFATAKFKLTDTESGVVSWFENREPAPADAGTWDLSKVDNPGSTKQITYDYGQIMPSGTGPMWPTRMLAPVSDAGSFSCGTSFGAEGRGCQALGFVYSDITVGAGTKKRLTKIQLRTWDPNYAPAQMRTIDIAWYSYDSSGRLAKACDPRLLPGGATVCNETVGPATVYAYDANNLLTQVTPGTEQPINITYQNGPQDLTPGRVQNTSRSSLGAGTGTATTAIRYGVPLYGAGSPYDMSPATVKNNWGQTTPPLLGTAVFPPDQQPNGSPPTNWSVASISYLDALGREMNHAEPTERITTTEYDKFNNVTRTLSAKNRSTAIATPDVPPGNRAATARLLDTQNTYGPDGNGGVRLIETKGPKVLMHDDQNDTMVPARPRKTFTYNESDYVNPSCAGTEYNLPTTITTSRSYVGTSPPPDDDIHTSRNMYESAISCKTGTPTTTITDPAGLIITRKTSLNAQGQETQRSQPSDTAGGGPGTTKTIYYTADASSGDLDCDNQPQWIGLPCKVKPAAQPSTPLPEKTIKYNLYRQPLTINETAGSDTRTTTFTYDSAGRKTQDEITGSAGTGRTVPRIKHIYNPVTGREDTTQSLKADGTVDQSVSRTYDALGRQTGYTDGAGHTSQTTFDLLSRVATQNDGKAVQSMGYDPTTGDLTTVTDSVVGAMTASYDANGNITAETLPGGLTKTFTYDEAAQLNHINYTKSSGCSSNCVWFDDTVERGTDGSIAHEVSELAEQYFSYDKAGRLKGTQYERSGQCTIRKYTLDVNSNRTQQNSVPPLSGGACNYTGTGTQRTHTYDSADRITDSGYVYDSFGRTTTVPQVDAGGTGNLTAAYFTNDLASSITQNGTTQTLDLDPMLRAAKKTKTGSTTGTETYAFDSDSDSPAWIQTSATAWTRYVSGIDGDLAVTFNSAGDAFYAITDIRGNQVGTADAGGVDSVSETDEFGVPSGGTLAAGVRYAYKGEKQREALTVGGTIAMGVRLYVPGTGRFLQVDPVLGGSDNPYEYAGQDPVNGEDLDGRRKARIRITYNAKQTRRIIRHLRSEARAKRDLADTDNNIGNAGVGAAFVEPWTLVPAAAAFALGAYRNKKARDLEDQADLLEDLLEDSGGRGINVVIRITKKLKVTSFRVYAKGVSDPRCGWAVTDFDGKYTRGTPKKCK